MEHVREDIPLPTLDCWKFICSCGKFNKNVSYWDFKTKEDLFREADKLWIKHINSEDMTKETDHGS